MARLSDYTREQVILARTIWGEARGEGARGMEAAGHVILNRAAIAQMSPRHARIWGEGIEGVATHTNYSKKAGRHVHMFTAWDPRDPNHSKLTSVTTNDRRFATALEVAKGLTEGRYKDITNGADHYYARYVNPSWGKDGTYKADIGIHHFRNLSGKDPAPTRAALWGNNKTRMAAESEPPPIPRRPSEDFNRAHRADPERDIRITKPLALESGETRGLTEKRVPQGEPPPRIAEKGEVIIKSRPPAKPEPKEELYTQGNRRFDWNSEGFDRNAFNRGGTWYLAKHVIQKELDISKPTNEQIYKVMQDIHKTTAEQYKDPSSGISKPFNSHNLTDEAGSIVMVPSAEKMKNLFGLKTANLGITPAPEAPVPA